MVSTAEQMKQTMGDQIELSDLKWLHFPDGFPNLEVKKEDALRLENFYGTCIILSFHSPSVIFEQLCLLYALPRMRARNFRIILPWFSTGTMERVEKIGQIATASSLARMLSATPCCPTGPSTVVIYDIHALQEQFYFSDNVLVELKSAVWLLKMQLDRLKKDNPSEEIAIAFPDDGAHKRFKAKFEGYPMIVCAKVRDGDKRIVQIKEGEPAGRHCVIVDDLVQSGGTLLECIKPLKEQGATKASCYCTHGIFPNESYKKFIGNDQVHKFWITDSIPTTVSAVAGQQPFEILSLAPLLAEYLRGNTQES
jgi:ribose-phosphate pyrophosphokinase